MAVNKLLDVNQSLFLIIDIQEAFRPHIPDLETIIQRTQIMVQAAKILGLPIVVTEQYPKGLGRTVELLQQSLGESRYYEKTAFSVMNELGCQDAIRRAGRKQIIIAGIEAHVCVLQTALQLLQEDFQVFIAADAVGSRRKVDNDLALERLRQAGAVTTTVEAAIMEMTVSSRHPSFKEISKTIK